MGRTKKNKENTKLTLQKKQNRERVRKFRAKMTDEALAKKRRKDRERYKKRKDEGLVKSIEELDDKEKLNARRKWKKATAKYREKKKMENYLNKDTPPESENEEIVIPVAVRSEEFSRSGSGRKKVRRDRAKAYRRLHAAEEKIKKLKKDVEKYRKRVQRLSTPTTSKSESPNSKVNKMTYGHKISKTIRQRLLFGEALTLQLQENLTQASGEQEKQIIRKAVSGKVLKKCRVIGEANKIISYKMHKKFESRSELLQYDRKKRNYGMTEKLKKQVCEFLEKDENSKMCPGKKDYVTQRKIKKQKRLLLDSLTNLHKKLKVETKCKISYKTFCRFRPFWIVHPKWSDRETCGCVKHSNIQLLANKLFSKGAISSKRAESILAGNVCNMKNIDCMFGNCVKCRKNKTSCNSLAIKNERVEYEQWETITEEKNIKGQEKKVRRTLKTKKSASIGNLIQIFNNQMVAFSQHLFIMKHQMCQMQMCKSNCESGDLVIQIDFSENYMIKYSSEIQAMHFGASKKQLSLHTGLYYVKEDKEVTNFSFCSVSENLDHQAYAIWIHLKYILEKLSRLFPNTATIHFLSDGPTSQYRNRSNFYYLLMKLPPLFPNLENISWNYSASVHGKGPMDGVGGALKRRADRLVLQDHDITSANDFVTKLQDSKVELWEVPDEEFSAARVLQLPKHLPAIPSIMTLHQITWSKKLPAHLFLRHVSCFQCPFDTICSHYPMKKPSIQFLPDISSANTPIQESRPRRINIISNVLLAGPQNQPEADPLQDFQNKKVNTGLCYLCTGSFKCNTGLKCINCQRTYHLSCAIKHNFYVVQNVLMCSTCSRSRK